MSNSRERLQIQFGPPATSGLSHPISHMPHFASRTSFLSALSLGLCLSLFDPLLHADDDSEEVSPPSHGVVARYESLPVAGDAARSLPIVVERLEAVPRLFGREGETPDHRLPGPGFMARWSGQLLVRYEGTYEFTVLRSSLENLTLMLDGRPVLLGEGVELESGPPAAPTLRPREMKTLRDSSTDRCERPVVRSPERERTTRAAVRCCWLRATALRSRLAPALPASCFLVGKSTAVPHWHRQRSGCLTRVHPPARNASRHLPPAVPPPLWRRGADRENGTAERTPATRAGFPIARPP